MKIFVLSVLCLLLTHFAFGQKDEAKQLMQKISVLYNEAKFDDAIPLAEKLVEIEQNASPRNAQSIATAILNLGNLRKMRAQLTRRKIEVSTKDRMFTRQEADKIEELIKAAKKDAAEAEKLFRQAIDIHQKELKTETPQLATAKNELAWVLYNYSEIPRDISAQERTAQVRTRIDESESLYEQALALREKLLGADHDATLTTVLNLADLYRNFVNFEKALPLYERFIGATEKKRGKTDDSLIPALRSYAEILVTTDNNAEAAQILKQLSEATGKSEKMPAADENISLRITRSELARLQSFPDREDVMKQLARERKRLRVNVVIDETGKVTEAFIDTDDKKLKAEIEDSVKTITFRPFVYKGAARKMRGYVNFQQLPFKS